MPERTAELQSILEQIAYEEGYSAALREAKSKAGRFVNYKYFVVFV